MKKQFILLLLVLTVSSVAQIKKPLIFEAKVHSGIILPFYDAIAYLIEDDLYALDLSVSFPTYGSNYWEKMYRYPRTGLGYSYWSLGNDEVFGKAHALYGFVNIPFFKPRRKFSLNYQISFGASYLTKKFDVYEDHLNRAISSRFNVFIQMGIDAKIKVLPYSEIVLGAGGAHFSNGKTHSPNYGINAGTFSLGFNYLFNRPEDGYKDPDPFLLTKRIKQTLIFSASSKVYDNLMGTKYFASSLNYNCDYLINHKRRIGLGADLFYDGSIKEALAKEENVSDSEFKDYLRFGLHISHSIQYKKLMMGIQVGHYLYSKYTDMTSVYNRISVQYLITEQFLFNISVKSHFAKADFIEWGIGYNW